MNPYQELFISMYNTVLQDIDIMYHYRFQFIKKATEKRKKTNSLYIITLLSISLLDLTISEDSL